MSKRILEDFKQFYCSQLTNPPYPPYHTGPDLEESFIRHYINNQKEFDTTGWIFVPVKWTAILNNNPHLIPVVCSAIESLDSTCKYFTVSQHDDAPFCTSFKQGIHFSAGGNIKNTIPIPLICNKIPRSSNNNSSAKTIFCSFVGSVSPDIGGNCSLGRYVRMSMLNELSKNHKYVLKPKHWAPHIDKSREELFLDVTRNSKFCLCPRGYGATSFRLYEAMQLRSVPVYIYDKEPHLPFTDKLDWNKLAVLIDLSNINKLDSILTSISEQEYSEKVNYADSIYDEFFTLDSLPTHVLSHLYKLNYEKAAN